MAPLTTSAAGAEDASAERAGYWLRHLPSHLAGQERWADLANLLLHPVFIQDKVKSLGMPAMLADLDLIDRRDFAERIALDKLRAALRLASSIVETDHQQLGPQLLCRLCGATEPALTKFKEALERLADQRGPWLSSLHPSLVQAGSALRTVLPVSAGGNSGVRFLDDDSIMGIQGTDISIWSLASGDEVHRFSGAGRQLHCFEVDASRSLLVFADEHAIHAWDVKRRSRLWKAGCTRAPQALVIADRAGLLLTLDANGIGLFDLRTGEGKGACSVEILQCIAATPDGTGFLSGSIDGRIDLWEFPDRELRRFARHGARKGPRIGVSELLFRTQSVRPMWASTGDTLKPIPLGDMEGAEDLLQQLGVARSGPDPAADAINALSFAAGGTRVLSASEDRSACIWSWPEGQLVHCLPAHGGAVTSVIEIPGRDAVATSSKDGNVRVWDWSQKLPASVLTARGSPIVSLAVSPDGKTIAATGRAGHVEIYDLSADISMPEVSHAGGVRAIAALTDPAVLVTVGQAEISHRSVPNLVQVRSFRAPSAAVLWLTLDGRRLLMQESAGSGATILAVDVLSGDVIQRLPIAVPPHLPPGWEQGWQYRQAACDDAGLRLISVGTGATIPTAMKKAGIVALWDFRTGRQIAVLHENGAHARVAIAPDASLAFMLDELHLTAIHALDGRVSGHIGVPAQGPMMVTRDCRYCVIAGDEALVWVGLDAPLAIKYEVAVTPRARVDRLCGNADGSLVATVHDDGSIACWSPGGGFVARFVADSPLTSVSFFDDRTIVAGDSLGRLHMLALRSAQGCDTGGRLAPASVSASPWGTFDRARRCEAERDAGAARRLWAELAECEHASLAPLGMVARGRLHLLGNEEAAVALDLRMAATPTHSRAGREEALARLEAGGRADAIAELMERAQDAQARLTDGDGWLVAAAARALARLGAVPQLMAVMENWDASPVARISSARSLLLLGADSAAESFLTGIVLDPGVPVSIALAAQRVLADGAKPERAIELLSEHYPDYPSAELRHAAVEYLVEIGDIGYLALGLDHGPGKDEVPDIFWSANGFANLGMKHVVAGDIKSAIHAYEHATALAPDNAVFHFNLGASLLRDRLPAEAIECFSKALALDPQYEKAYCERGTAHRMLNQFDQALENYSRAIELKPDESFNYQQRAALYRLLDANDSALADEQMIARLTRSKEAPPAFELVENKAADQVRPDMSQPAAAALASIGVTDLIAERLLKIAVDGTVPLDICLSSIRALGKLQRFDALARLARDSRLDEAAQATAFYLWALSAPDTTSTLVEHMITDPRLEASTRSIALEVFVQTPSPDMLQLAGRIPDLSFRDNEPSVGLQLAGHMLNAYGIAYGHDAIREMAFAPEVSAPLREQAGEWLAVAGHPEGMAALKALSEDRRVDRVTRAVAARSLEILQSRQAMREPEPARSEPQRAFDSICASHTEKEMCDLVEQYPFVTKFGFILQLRRVALSCEHPADRAQMLQKIGWIEAAPASFEDRVLRLAFDAPSESQLRVLADRYSILANQAFQTMLGDIVTEYGSPADQSALAVRMRWLQKLEANPIQEAMQEVIHFTSREEVLKYAKTRPIIRSPGFIDAFERMLRNALPEGTRTRAEQILVWVREASGDEGRLLDDAQALVSANDDAGALELLDRIIAGFAPPRFAFMLRGLVHANLERHDRAVDDFTQYLKEGGSAATTYERRGRSYVHLKQWNEAVKDFNQALALDAENADVLFGLAVANDALGNRKASRSAMARLTELRPDDTGILMCAAMFAYADDDRLQA